MAPFPNSMFQASNVNSVWQFVGHNLTYTHRQASLNLVLFVLINTNTMQVSLSKSLILCIKFLHVQLATQLSTKFQAMEKFLPNCVVHLTILLNPNLQLNSDNHVATFFFTCLHNSMPNDKFWSC